MSSCSTNMAFYFKVTCCDRDALIGEEDRMYDKHIYSYILHIVDIMNMFIVCICNGLVAIVSEKSTVFT